MLDFKELNEFVSAAREVNGNGQTAWQKLWDVVEGKPVLSEELKMKFVDRETVYATISSEIAASHILKPIGDGVQKLYDLIGFKCNPMQSLNNTKWVVIWSKHFFFWQRQADILLNIK